MAPMPQSQVASKQCPVCAGKPVARIPGASGFGSPTFRCPHCGAGLTTGMTLQVLWAVPVCLASCGAAYAIVTWLQQTHHVGGIAFAALGGGLFGGAFSLSAKVALRGIVFRPCKA